MQLRIKPRHHIIGIVNVNEAEDKMQKPEKVLSKLLRIPHISTRWNSTSSSMQAWRKFDFITLLQYGYESYHRYTVTQKTRHPTLVDNLAKY